MYIDTKQHQKNNNKWFICNLLYLNDRIKWLEIRSILLINCGECFFCGSYEDKSGVATAPVSSISGWPK